MTTIGFTGHRKIPSEGRGEILAQLEAFLDRLQVQQDTQQPTTIHACCSLAAGADQIFADAVLARSGELHAIIPSADFIVTLDTDEAARHYKKLLGTASTIDYLPFDHACDEAYEAAGKAIVNECDHLLAIWDGEPPAGPGGTGDVVSLAREQDIPVTVLWVDGIHR